MCTYNVLADIHCSDTASPRLLRTRSAKRVSLEKATILGLPVILLCQAKSRVPRPGKGRDTVPGLPKMLVELQSKRTLPAFGQEL
jgi:hypothetical protein